MPWGNANRQPLGRRRVLQLGNTAQLIWLSPKIEGNVQLAHLMVLLL